jgi:hypothetical protein
VTDRQFLLWLFPRGRLAKDSDGTHILVTSKKNKARAHDHAYRHAVDALGIFYVGTGRPYLNRLQDLVEDHLRADGEGIIVARVHVSLKTLLPWFSRQRVPDADTRHLRMQI